MERTGSPVQGEERERVLRRGREALRRIRARARELGLDRITTEEIDAGIRAARAELRR